MSVNGTLVEDKMRRFKGECAQFSFNKCPIYTHDGAVRWPVSSCSLRNVQEPGASNLLKSQKKKYRLSSLRSGRVFFETSFDSKKSKLEPKLISAISERKCLFRLFHFCVKKASFGRFG